MQLKTNVSNVIRAHNMHNIAGSPYRVTFPSNEITGKTKNKTMQHYSTIKYWTEHAPNLQALGSLKEPVICWKLKSMICLLKYFLSKLTAINVATRKECQCQEDCEMITPVK